VGRVSAIGNLPAAVGLNHLHRYRVDSHAVCATHRRTRDWASGKVKARCCLIRDEKPASRS